MKTILIAVSVIFAVVGFSDAFQCDGATSSVNKDAMNMTNECVEKVRGQIQTEIGASIQYLAMGAHFSRDTINRPGFAEFFFHAANEEREHATKLIEYLLMRIEVTDVNELITVKQPEKVVWATGLEALQDALAKEVSVTESIKNVIGVCENDKGNNDYHFVDYLTGEFLDEQYKGQRDLAGRISTLSKMTKSKVNAQLAEFLYDKQML